MAAAASQGPTWLSAARSVTVQLDVPSAATRTPALFGLAYAQAWRVLLPSRSAEAEAVSKVFGSAGPPMTSTKGVTGHSLGAAGAIEAVAVVLSMQHKLIPPTHGFTTPDPEIPEVNLVTGAAQAWEPGPTLSNSFGFGGHNGTLVLGPAS